MKCHSCGFENDDANKFCEKCGQPLEKKPSVCPKCGNVVSENAVFCPVCGEKIVKPESQPKSQQKKVAEKKVVADSPKSNKKFLWIALAVLVLGGVAAWFIFFANSISYKLVGVDNGNQELVAVVKGKTIYSKVKHHAIEIGEIKKGDDKDEIEVKAADGLVEGSKIVTFDKKSLEFFDEAKKIKFKREGDKIFVYEDVCEYNNDKLVKYTKQSLLGNVKVVFDSPAEINPDNKSDNNNYVAMVSKHYDIDGDGKKDQIKFYQSDVYNSVVRNHAADIVIQFANGKKSNLTTPANFVCILTTKSKGVNDILITAEGFKNSYSMYKWNGNFYEEKNDNVVTNNQNANSNSQNTNANAQNTNTNSQKTNDNSSNAYQQKVGDNRKWVTKYSSKKDVKYSYFEDYCLYPEENENSGILYATFENIRYECDLFPLGGRIDTIYVRKTYDEIVCSQLFHDYHILDDGTSMGFTNTMKTSIFFDKKKKRFCESEDKVYRSVSDYPEILNW
ncbi:MAG: zinc-ribbon domain-containing protein [Bacteroidales bacterium]|nr:zinc-ribbon domain-containing protein [Bacteroidales bacterium]